MPTYTYECDTCDEKFEVMQGMSEKPLKNVPLSDAPCGKKCKSKCTKVLTPPAINLQQGKANVTRQQGDGASATVTDHWDGRRDVNITPDPVEVKVGLKNAQAPPSTKPQPTDVG